MHGYTYLVYRYVESDTYLICVTFMHSRVFALDEFPDVQMPGIYDIYPYAYIYIFLRAALYIYIYMDETGYMHLHLRHTSDSRVFALEEEMLVSDAYIHI